jgi:class 3 adenylate cyclase
MTDQGPADDQAKPARLERALLAHVRQEFSAPAAAIVEYARMLIADAGRFGLDQMADDLARIRTAGETLNAQVTSLLEPGRREANGDIEDFRTRLRHDLRTPISAVKGYGEMLAEDARAAGHEGFAKDLDRLLDAANRMLKQIDQLALIGASEPGSAEAVLGQEHLVAAALDTIAPVGDDGLQREIEPSHILVIDDNESNREMLSRRLTREGHTVVTAADGEKGLAALDRSACDLILLDLVMPGISGFEVLRRIKQSAEWRHIPVIMISAVDEIDSIVRCIELGAEDYLLKPFNPVLLQARVNASLEKQQLRKREQAAVHDLEAERAKSEKLLLNILPKPIATRLKVGEELIADRFQDATILFADLVGFTPLSTRLQPRQLVDVLNRIFSAFDRLALDFGLEKIKTIGDAYMAAAGLPEPRPDHARAAAEMALAMMARMREFKSSIGENLQLRIGLHSGPVVAGVIGTHKFVYDAWGDTVNTASRMESHGKADEIHVSPAAFRHLRNDYTFSPCGPVEIKGKGTMETYFLRGRRAKEGT